MVKSLNVAVLAMLSCLALAYADAAGAQEPEQPWRELFVPFEELDVLLGSDTRQVYMSRAEYEDLLSKANVKADQAPPEKIALLSANYRAEVSEGRAAIQGELQLEVIEAGMQVLPLKFSGVGVRTAKLDDAPAALAKNDQGQVWLFIEGVGKHRLTLDLIMPIATEAAQQTLQLQIPTAPTGEFELAIPGNIEIKSGAAIISRNVDDAAGKTIFKILPTQEPMSMVMSLNNRTLRAQSTIVARGVLIAEVTQAYERLHATVSMNVLNGSSDEFRFAIDDDLEVNSVTSELLSRWSIEKVDGKQQLLVSLRTPATDREVVNIRLDRITRKLDAWRMPIFEPISVAGYSAVVGLLAEDRLNVTSIEPEALIAIDSKLLLAALPASLMVSEPGAPRLSAVATYYAAQSPYVLTAQFAPKSARVGVNSRTYVTLSDGGLTVEGRFTLLPQNEKLFFFEFECPAAWTIDSVKSAEQQELKFDRFPEAVDSGSGPVARIRVSLPSGIAAGGQQSILFRAQLTPADWFAPWQSSLQPLPNFRVLNTENQFGVVALQLEDNLQVTPESTQGLMVLSADEKARFQLADSVAVVAYRFDAADWSATQKVTRTAPRVVALVQSFVQINTEALNSHSEITFHVKQASVQSVVFALPESTPAEVAISGLGDTVVKESSSVIAEGRRVWSVQLAERKSDAVRIAVDFTQALNTEKTIDANLPIARAQDVAYQSGTIAVEGHSELEIEMKQSPRSVDIGELVDAKYQVGKRLIGVFGYVGVADAAIATVARRSVHRLPTTIVERAELVTLVSVHGFSQTAARFKLRTKAAYIESQLPVDAKLWSAVLDGKSALPQREGDRVLIAIPPNNRLAVRDLQLVYESPTDQVRMRGEIGIFAPSLSEREDANAEMVSVPIADAKWNLILPHGYQIALTGGNLRSDHSIADKNSIEWLFKKFWEIGGGGDTVLASAALERRVDIGFAPRGGTTWEYMQQAPDAKSVAPSIGNDPFLGGTASATPSAAPSNPLPPSQPAAQLGPGRESVSKFDLRDGAVELPAISEFLGRSDPTSNSLPQSTNLDAQGDSAFMSPSVALPEQNAMNRSAALTKKELWAMEGVRSLAIELDERIAGGSHSLTSLGLDPQAQVTLVHKARFDWLAGAIGIVVLVVGLVLVPRRRTARIRYFLAVGLIAFLAPPVTGWYVELEPVTTAAIVSLMVLAAVILIGEIVKRLSGGLARIRESDKPAAIKGPAVQSVTTILLAITFACTLASVTQAQSDQPPGKVVTNAEQLTSLIQALDDGGKVSLPADAVIIPFDASRPENFEDTQKLLVPYDQYVKLWNLGNPDKKLTSTALPAKFAWSAAQYSLTLESSATLRMTSSITIDQFTDHEIAIPMQLAGCVIESASLDGQPPRLQMLTVEPQVANQQAAQVADESSLPAAMYVLYTKGKGRKQLEMQLRWQLDQRSGWRALEGKLPATPAAELTITVPKSNTEVRLAGGVDRTNFETTEVNAKIVTALPADGRLSLNWRDKITEARVDQGLTVQARSVFDIQEDALKLAWHGQFEFRRGRRESFTLQVPKGYIVEKVVGANIRGWTVKELDAVQQLDVELLKSVTDRETLIVFISKQSAINAQASAQVAVPQIVVPDAMLHQGHVAVRRSLLLDVRAESTNGLARMEAIDESSWMAGHEIVGILPIKVYQAYRYSQVPFELSLAVSSVQASIQVQSQSLLKISQLERTLETRLLMTSKERPIYRLQIALPSEWKFQTPEVPGSFQWSLSPSGNQQLMQIYLADGQSNEFPVVLRGKVIGEAQTNDPLELPRIEVIDAQRQTGSIVVQSDPAYDVRAANLQGCESALLDSVKGWLANNQRESARVVIRFQVPQYSGQLVVTPRAPVVKSFSVTNVKVTDRAIEETLFIEADIRSAGIREFVFRMPVSLATAKIQAPHLRQIVIQPIADDADSVRVQLLLQDAIMGQFRVVVEHDRELSGGPHTAPLPLIETGATDLRLVTLENAGRDELVTSKAESFEQLDRSQLQQRFQADLLGGLSSQAYLAKEGADVPKLAFVTKTREMIATVGARIGLAQTLLVVDEVGTYRATQEYRVENRTEPYLEVELPVGSRLWTVQVAGEAVKPAVASSKVNTSINSNNSPSTKERVRIPLIKTAEGDLDYAVVIKYGGQMETPNWLNRVEFPLIHTSNINVELSQVRLRLPESVGWFSFDGTLGRVQSESELQAGWLSYRTRQLTELSQLLGSKASVSDYTRYRALSNLSTLQSSIQESNSYFSQNADRSESLAKQLSSNSAALESAQQQAAAVAQSQVTESRSNRALLNDLYGEQANSRSFNALNDLGQNFEVPMPRESKPLDAKDAASQNAWFEQNKLNSKPADELSRLSVVAEKAQDPTALTPKPDAVMRTPFDVGNPFSRKQSANAQQSEGAITQAQRYGRRLNEQNLGYLGPETDIPANAPRQGQQAQIDDYSGFQVAGGMAGGSGGPGIGGGGSGGEGGYLASLDVDFPVRGREYFFSTPRGEVQLSAQGMATRTSQRLYAIMTVLVVAVGLWASYLISLRLAVTRWGMIAMVLALALLGSVSLAQQYLPVYGGLALLVAMVLVVSKWDARAPQVL